MTQDEMKELREYFDGKFEAVDKRFEGVDRRFDGVDHRFDRIDAIMERGFGAIRAQFTDLRECLDSASERTCARIDKHFDALRADLRISKEQE